MNRMLTVKGNEMNDFLKCPLCKGYLIDAFSINECLHSFCKSCIIKYIKRKECCPTCKVSINKDRMRLFLRRDVNLQYIVYKLVPNLFKKEMQRRRAFYEKHPKAIKFLKKRKILDNETLGKLDENVFVFEKPSDISLSIEYSEQGLSEVCESMRTKEMDPTSPKTYLLCPATITIEILKKFLVTKHQTAPMSQMDIMYDDTPLRKELTLLDVGFIYAWRRNHPMRLFYRIRESETEATCLESAVNLAQTEKVSDQQVCSPPTVSTEDMTNSESQAISESTSNDASKLELSRSDEKASPNEVSTYQSISMSANDVINAKKELQFTDMDMSMDTSQHNNQTMNENLTITAMVASIESASRQITETPVSTNKIPNGFSAEPLSESRRLSNKLNTNTANIEQNRLETESNSDKENNAVNDSLVISSEKRVVNPENKVLESSMQKLNSTIESVINPSLTNDAVSQPVEFNNPVKLDESIVKAKSKKNPREAPGSSGGVAKKKKDALKSNNNNVNSPDNSGNTVQQAKKPRVQKPRPPSAKQNNDYKNLKIKPEPSVNTYQESHQQQKPHYPQIKVEPGAYNSTLQPFQHQIQQQFSLPSAQSLFSNQNIFNNKTNYNNSTDPNINSNPVFKNLQQNLPATNTSNSHLLANNFQMTSMSLMNHFLNNQKQQQQQPHKDSWSWNQFNNGAAVSNALQMSQKFNPQLFEYLQKAQSLQQQQQQHQTQQNFFNQNVQQNQFLKNQYLQEDYKPFPNGVPHYQEQLQNPYYNYLNPNNNFQQYNLSGSTCSSEGSAITSSTENLKEKGFSSLISESCNLVNELN